MRKRRQVGVVLLLVLIGCLMLPAQQSLPDAPQPQNNAPLPSAPSSVQPPPPATAPRTEPAKPSGTAANGDDRAPSSAPAPTPNGPAATVPPGQAPDGSNSAREELGSIYRKYVNFVVVPATVKDSSGHLVEGLLQNDFSVYEDGVQQKISFFTSDPFPLSAAVVLNSSLPQSQWNKVRDTLSALVGAFGQFDEIALLTYGDTVSKVQDFTPTNADVLTQSLRKIRARTGRLGGPPVVGGPMNSGPSINGQPVDPSRPHVQVMPKESYVLNDAILAAANELNRRDNENRARGIPPTRKIIFVISDGREVGSGNSYADVLRVLLTRQITLYAVGITTGIPGYRQAQKVRIPGLGYGDILPKYASATGGQVYAEANQQAIEDAYARVTEEARNQYTIGYTTRATPSTTYRSIEVRVRRPNLRVFARDGYYPLPPGR